MSPRDRRRWIDLAVSLALTMPVYVFGGIGVGLLATVYGLWCYWDGMTRSDLPTDEATYRPGDWIDP